jgi:hypothetical protein
MAATEGAAFVGRHMYQGVRDTMQGQSLMNQMSPSLGNASTRGQGAETGRMMRDMSEDLGVGMQDISRYAKQLDANKMFQTTRSAKEFRQKFQSVMKAVKEIAQMTQGTVDDAMQTFTGLRQQGFYTTADIKAQAASTRRPTSRPRPPPLMLERPRLD